MKGIVKLCLLLAMQIPLANTYAQNTAGKDVNTDLKPVLVKPKPIKKPKPLRTEFSGGFRLNTDGWGIFVDKGWVRSEEKLSDYFYNLRLLQLELCEKKSPREIKRTNTLGPSSNDKPTPFIYGKANNFYTFKLGYGNRRMIAGKPEPGNVSIHWVYLGGLSLGLLKPYYIDAYVIDNTGSVVQKSVTYTDSTKEDFLARQNIIGSSGFSKGLNEIKIIPGIQLKTALHFDFAASKHSVLALEAGAGIEYYTSTILLMANETPSSFFLNAFVSLQFGKRW